MPEVQESNSKIIRLCLEENLVRTTCFSDVYRAEFSLNGVKRYWDIEKITLPFSPEREEAYCIRFGLGAEDMPGIYRIIKRELRQHLNVGQALKVYAEKNPASKDKIQGSTLLYRHRDIQQNGDTIEAYIITEPAGPIIGSDMIGSGSAYASGIVQLGIRLLQTAKTYNDIGCHIGAFSLENTFLIKESSRDMVKVGNFFAGTFTEQKNAEVIKSVSPDLKAFMKPEIYSGTEQPSFSGDIYSACAIMWSLLNGNHPTEAPDLQFPPKYSFNRLTECLVLGMNQGEAAYKNISKTLRDISREMLESDSADNKDPLITFKIPDYIRRQQEALAARREAAKKALEEEEARKKAELEAKKAAEEKAEKKAKLKKIIPAAVLAAAVFAGGVFGYSRIAPSLLTDTTEPEVTETPAEEEAKLPTATSAELGLYLYNGGIVDFYGNPEEAYVIDTGGNIADENGDVVIIRDNAETYVYMSALKFGRNSYDITLPAAAADENPDTEKDNADGEETKSEPSYTEIMIQAGPSAATNKTVTLKLSGEGALTIPYSEIKEYLSDEFIAGLEDGYPEYTDIGGNEMLPLAEEPAAGEDAGEKADGEEREEPAENAATEYAESAGAAVLVSFEDTDKGETIIDLKGKCVQLSVSYDLDGFNGPDIKDDIDKGLKAVAIYKYSDADGTWTRLDGAMDKSGAVVTADITEPGLYRPAVYDIPVQSSGAGEDADKQENDENGGKEEEYAPDYADVNVIKEVQPTARETAERMLEEAIDGKHLTEFTLDFSKAGGSNSVTVKTGCSEEGLYDITISDFTGELSATATVNVYRQTAATPAPSPTQTPVESTYSGTAGTGLSGTSSGTTGTATSSAGGTTSVTAGSGTAATPTATASPTAAPYSEPEGMFLIVDGQFVTSAYTTLNVGDTYIIRPSVSCTWQCSNPHVATIDPASGSIVAYSAGECTITAYDYSGNCAYIVITVIAPEENHTEDEENAEYPD